MALDYLSAPASSVDAKCACSHGGLTVMHHHHALSDKSMHNSIVLGAWLKDTNLVPKEELIVMFRKKASRLQSSSSDSVVDNSNDSDST